MRAPHAGLLAAAVVLVLPAARPAAAQYGAVDGEWRSYGGDNGSTKYSPLDQIDAGNFDDLRIAWRWRSVDGDVDLEALRESEDDRPISIRGLQATPLMIDGVLYLTTALYQAAAVDAGTGETLWTHDPQAYLGGDPTHAYRSRGLAYWSDGDDARIFWGTSEAYLLAVDARTGEPVRDFGDDGRVDLMEGVPRAERGGTNHQGRNLVGVASPPVVTRGVVVTPTIISDFVIRKEAPPGWIKGVASWSGAAADPETGLLYVPSENRFSVIKYYTPDPAAGGNLRYTQADFDSGVQPAMPRGLPLLKPPYSRMTAIDLNAGEHAWMRPNGDGDRYRNHPLLRGLDLPPLGGEGHGGPVLTKTLLVSALSAGGSDGGPRLVARDKATGAIVGSVDLPAGAVGTPMTYLHEGKQYVALTVGGDVPELIAFALP